MHFHSHSNSGNSFITQECKAKIPFHFNTKQQKNKIIYPIQIFLNKHNKNTYKKNITSSFDCTDTKFCVPTYAKFCDTTNVARNTTNVARNVSTTNSNHIKQFQTTSNNTKTISNQINVARNVSTNFIVNCSLSIVNCSLSIVNYPLPLPREYGNYQHWRRFLHT